MVNISPWPLIGASRAFIVATGLLVWFKRGRLGLLSVGLLRLVLSRLQWWRDVTRESTIQGLHTLAVQARIKWGILLFIISEVIFFFSFFWSFFHHRLSPGWELGLVWPPAGVHPCDPFEIPLLGTLILLSSGGFCTWTHHSLLEGNLSEAKISLLVTVLLGALFSIAQLGEYAEASFTMADSVYGSTFFVITGFHGLHVIIGTIFLVVSLSRIRAGHFNPGHHFGFEAAAWYWHFVDVVWLFLYTFLYWWGS